MSYLKKWERQIKINTEIKPCLLRIALILNDALALNRSELGPDKRQAMIPPARASVTLLITAQIYFVCGTRLSSAPSVLGSLEKPPPPLRVLLLSSD